MTAIILMSLLLPVLLIASAFFSGSETALFSLSKSQRLQLDRTHSVVAGAITRLLGETRGLLITLLLGNMTVNVLYFAISAVVLIQLEDGGYAPGWLAAALNIVPLLAIILLGEVMPKLVASRLPMVWSRVIAVPLLVIHRGITPVRVSSSWFIIGPLARLISPPSRPPELSADELGALLDLSRRHGVIDRGEQELLQQVLELGELKVRDLMVPRVDLEAYDIEEPLDELLALIRKTKLRYVPVYRGSIDDIVGFAPSRLVLLHRPGNEQQLMTLIDEPLFVPEQQRADRLLIELRQRSRHLAVVVDEYGGTAGLVTIEDVVEHMVGEIAGSYDLAAEPEVVTVGTGTWRVSADLSVRDWPSLFGRNRLAGIVPLEDISTVGGLVMAMLGRVPQVGDEVRLGEIVLRVEKTDQHRPETVLVQMASTTAASNEEAQRP